MGFSALRLSIGTFLALVGWGCRFDPSGLVAPDQTVSDVIALRREAAVDLTDGSRDLPVQDKSSDTLVHDVHAQDTHPRDTRRDSLPRDQSPPPCTAKYGSLKGFVLCQQTSSSCKFLAVLDGGTCNSACASKGGTCLSVEEDYNNTCTSSGPGACGSGYGDALCICTR